MVILLFALMFVLFLINVPIAIAVGLATVTVAFLSGVQLLQLPQTLFASLNSFPLMAAPFFILAGKLMEYGGISHRLVNLANSLVGHFRGGLAYVAIMASMFFAAISGSAIATTVAVGSILIPAMIKMGYNRQFAASLHAAAGTTGVMIPPSIPMVLYGVSAGVSVGQLFIAGIVPGILVGISLMLVSYLFARKGNYETLPKQSAKEVWIALKDSIWALLLPIIILGGIYGGIFTPTEASVIAVVYGFIIGVFVYKQINFSVAKKILHSSVLTTAVLGIIISTASFFGMWLTMERVPHSIAESFKDANMSPIVTMLLINLFLLILGTFMEATAALVIATPILLPVVVSMGFDPIHFGIIIIVNLSIGLITPPLGVGLFIAAKVANTSYVSLIKTAIPFIIIMVVDVLLIILLPQLSVGVSNFMK